MPVPTPLANAATEQNIPHVDSVGWALRAALSKEWGNVPDLRLHLDMTSACLGPVLPLFIEAKACSVSTSQPPNG